MGGGLSVVSIWKKLLDYFSAKWAVESFLPEAQTKANSWDQIQAL